MTTETRAERNARLYGLLDYPAVHAVIPMVDLAALLADSSGALAEMQEVMDDERRLTRALDIALSGEENAAKQASLCDLIYQALRLREALSLAKELRGACLTRLSEKDEEIMRLRGALSFAKSVITSGELWSSTCEAIINAALVPAAEPKGVERWTTT